MKRYALTLIVFLSLTSVSFAQEKDAKSNGANATASTIPAPPPITANTTPVELARAALGAQGGDKFKNSKSMMIIGSSSLYAPHSSQSVPAKFGMVPAGDHVHCD